MFIARFVSNVKMTRCAPHDRHTCCLSPIWDFCLYLGCNIFDDIQNVHLTYRVITLFPGDYVGCVRVGRANESGTNITKYIGSYGAVYAIYIQKISLTI
jgi:hypothetical protein